MDSLLVSRGPRAPAVTLSKEERESLQALIRRGTAAHRGVQRARLALMVHEGHTSSAIASSLRLSRPTVTLWRDRLACQPAQQRGRATPTLDELCERATAHGEVDSVSRSHLQRILQACDVRPHRVRQWLHSPDPQFREKINAICRLHRQAPEGSVVLSIDEKNGSQAIEHKRADRAPQPGRLRRREFEDIRHGTQTRTAALGVHSGRVLARCTDRRTQDDLVAWMDSVASA